MAVITSGPSPNQLQVSSLMVHREADLLVNLFQLQDDPLKDFQPEELMVFLILILWSCWSSSRSHPETKTMKYSPMSGGRRQHPSGGHGTRSPSGCRDPRCSSDTWDHPDREGSSNGSCRIRRCRGRGLSV